MIDFRKLRLPLLVGGAVLISVAGTLALAADPNQLWDIVHNHCVVSTKPCLEVDKQEHFALLKDRGGIAQILLIPTDKITGIEDPAVLQPAMPNFFADAWLSRDYMQKRLPTPLPRDEISLAINAPMARSQNQLHIHIDCLSTTAYGVLTAEAGSLGTTWTQLTQSINGHQFTARRVDGDTLGTFDPFIEVAATLANPAKDMDNRNIAVVGATFSTGPGFIILTDVAPAKGPGFGGAEDVQDHKCAIDKAANGK